MRARTAHQDGYARACHVCDAVRPHTTSCFRDGEARTESVVRVPNTLNNTATLIARDAIGRYMGLCYEFAALMVSFLSILTLIRLIQKNTDTL